MSSIKDFRALFNTNDITFILSVYNQYFNKYGKEIIKTVFDVADVNDNLEVKIRDALRKLYPDELANERFLRAETDDYVKVIKHCFLLNKEIEQLCPPRPMNRLISIINNYIDNRHSFDIHKIDFITDILNFCSSLLLRLRESDGQEQMNDIFKYFKHNCYSFTSFNTAAAVDQCKFILLNKNYMQKFNLPWYYANYYIYIISSYKLSGNYSSRAIIAPYKSEDYFFELLNNLLSESSSNFMRELVLLFVFNLRMIKFDDLNNYAVRTLKTYNRPTNYVHLWLEKFFLMMHGTSYLKFE
jgi:hypothetical protein